MVEAIIGVLGTAVFICIGWAFSLSKDVAVLQEKDKDYKELMNARFDAVDHRLERMERAMNGKLKDH